MDKMELTPFVTQDQNRTPAKRQRYFSSGTTSRLKKRNSRREAPNGLSMMVKVGICVGVCALALAFQWANTPFTDSAVQAVNAAITDEVDLDEMLGKLQFVELPGILSVFSASAKLEAPVAATSSYLIDSSRMAVFEAVSGSDIVCSFPGTVAELSFDQILGNCVTVEQKNGLTVHYYGFAEILVEAGQPVKKLDTLGTVAASGTVCVSIYQDGRPLDASDYFTMLGD